MRSISLSVLAASLFLTFQAHARLSEGQTALAMSNFESNSTSRLILYSVIYSAIGVAYLVAVFMSPRDSVLAPTKYLITLVLFCALGIFAYALFAIGCIWELMGRFHGRFMKSHVHEPEV